MLPLSEFDKIKELVYSYAGISLKDSRLDFLSRRVYSRMKALDLKEVRDYLRFVIFDRSGKEMEELINLIVVSESYFFRDYPQLKLLAEEMLPEIVRERGGNRKLSILCAGCSTGEEPYTLAIILNEMLDDADEWRLRIDGLDINRNSLHKAREGVYTDHALRETPYAYRDRYFTKKDDLNALSPDVMKMVGFMRGNLFNGNQMSGFLVYDIVLCRNVLIYFDYASAEKVLEYLYGLMNPGGYIFLGSAESVGRLTNLFTMVRFGKSFVYQK